MNFFLFFLFLSTPDRPEVNNVYFDDTHGCIEYNLGEPQKECEVINTRICIGSICFKCTDTASSTICELSGPGGRCWQACWVNDDYCTETVCEWKERP